MKCGYCGTPFIPQYPHQKYCSKDCSRYTHQRQKREYARRRYRMIRNKELIQSSQFKPGTTDLHEHRLPTDEEEYQRIQKELRRLKLSRSNNSREHP